ncbi:hypothetical protein QE152_g36963 [Popillia japonica]|uniref:Uncharacterized protein n=1 Tax=Popillia japonica TaxID=7064 RepID=A0AAW1IB78_POPJA
MYEIVSEHTDDIDAEAETIIQEHDVEGEDENNREEEVEDSSYVPNNSTSEILSSDDEETKNTHKVKRQRRKRRGKETWDCNQNKYKRMRGFDYKGRGKCGKGKTVFNIPRLARKMLPRCNCKRGLKGKTLKCKEFSSENRQEVFNAFWETMNWQERKHYIRGLVDVMPVKRKSQDESRRDSTFVLKLKKDGISHTYEIVSEHTDDIDAEAETIIQEHDVEGEDEDSSYVPNNSTSEILSSDDEETKNTHKVKRQRRKRRGKETWDCNQNKYKRMRGFDYKGRGKCGKGKTVFNIPRLARKMLPRCNCKRGLKGKTLKCKEFSSENRQEVFNAFWETMNWQERKHYIRGLVDVMPVKRKSQDESRRDSTFVLKLKKDGISHTVCKKMFLNTLGTGEWSLHNWTKPLINKSNSNSEEATQKVKNPRNTESKMLIQKGHTPGGGEQHAFVHRKLKNRDINIPAEYAVHCKKARKLPKPYHVQYLNHNFFHNHSKINYYKYIRPGIRSGDSVVNDLKVIRYTPNKEIYMKLNHTDESCLLNKGCNNNVVPVTNDSLPQLYSGPREISKDKFEHLQELKSSLLVDFHSFYDHLNFNDNSCSSYGYATKMVLAEDVIGYNIKYDTVPDPELSSFYLRRTSRRRSVDIFTRLTTDRGQPQRKF